jgi:hypothetical protein
MKSIGMMVRQLCGLAESDVTAWESNFILSIDLRTNNGRKTSELSEKQIEVVEKLYQRHFGDKE